MNYGQIRNGQNERIINTGVRNEDLPPVEYNGGQLLKTGKNNAKSIAIDTLKLNLEGTLNSALPSPIFELKAAEYGTKIFNAVHEVIYRGEVLGNVLSKPRSSALKSDLIQFELVNWRLYDTQNTLVGLKSFLEEYQLRFSSVNRIDIAVDFNRFDSCEWLDLNHKWKAKEWTLKGRSKEYAEFGTVKGGDFHLNGFTLGKRGNERYLRSYNKSLELQESTHKDYIVSYWESFGIDTNQTVYRLEIQLNNKFMKLIDGFNLDKLFELDHLIDLFECGIDNYFDMVENRIKGKNKNRNKEIELLNLSGLRGSKPPELIKSRTNERESSTRAKYIAMRALFREYVSAQQSEVYLLSMVEIMNQYKFNDLFDEKHGYWVAEFMDLQKVKYEFDWQKLNEDLKLSI